MKTVLGLIAVYGVCQALLVGLAVAVGFLLHWLIPAIDLQTAVLVGVASTIASVYVFIQFLKSAPILVESSDETEDADEEEEDSSTLHVALRPLGSRRQRRKKRK